MFRPGTANENNLVEAAAVNVFCVRHRHIHLIYLCENESEGLIRVNQSTHSFVIRIFEL
jgi:hypothetical protein